MFSQQKNICKSDSHLWKTRIEDQQNAQEILLDIPNQFPLQLEFIEFENKFIFTDSELLAEPIGPFNLQEGENINVNGIQYYTLIKSIARGVQGQTFVAKINSIKKERVAKFSSMVKFPVLHQRALKEVINENNMEYKDIAIELLDYLKRNSKFKKTFDEEINNPCSENYNDVMGNEFANNMISNQYNPSFTLLDVSHVISVNQYDFKFYKEWLNKYYPKFENETSFINSAIYYLSQFNFYQVILIEKLDDVFYNFLEYSLNNPSELNANIIKSTLTQILFALKASQDVGNFNHNDFHYKNVLLMNVDPKICLYYQIKENDQIFYYRIPTFGKLAVLIDYGRFTAKIKQDNGEVIVNYDCNIEAKQYSDWVSSHWKYTKYADMIRLFYFIYTKFFNKLNKNPLFKDVAELTKAILYCCDEKQCINLIKKYENCIKSSGQNEELIDECDNSFRTDPSTTYNCDSTPFEFINWFYDPIEESDIPIDAIIYAY